MRKNEKSSGRSCLLALKKRWCKKARETIRGFSEEKENGQTTYEVAMVVNGHTKDVQMDPNGTVLEVEEQVDLETLSAEVKAGLQAKAGAGKITAVESITKKDKLVTYEAQEVQVGPDGKPLNREE